MTLTPGPFVRRNLVRLLSVCLAPLPSLHAAESTICMAILSSQMHQLNRSDNPLVGLFVSSDRGVTWEHRGWREYIRTFHAVEGADGTIWSACGNGVLRSTDAGKSWKITTGWEITEVLRIAVDPLVPKHVFAATAYGPIASTDGGESWSFRNDGLRRHFVSDICVDRSDGRHLLLASELGIFTSRDAGKHWRAASLNNTDIRTIVQDPRKAETFWAGTEENGLWCSTDGGTTWHPLNTGLAHRTVYCIVPDPDSAGLIFAGTHGGGVYRSTDSGSTWQQVVNGLSNRDVHSLVLLGGAHPVLFAGTLNGGLFESTDRGDHWKLNSQDGGQVWGLSVGAGRKGNRK